MNSSRGPRKTPVSSIEWPWTAEKRSRALIFYIYFFFISFVASNYLSLLAVLSRVWRKPTRRCCRETEWRDLIARNLYEDGYVERRAISMPTIPGESYTLFHFFTLDFFRILHEYSIADDAKYRTNGVLPCDGWADGCALNGVRTCIDYFITDHHRRRRRSDVDTLPVNVHHGATNNLIPFSRIFHQR